MILLFQVLPEEGHKHHFTHIFPLVFRTRETGCPQTRTSGTGAKHGVVWTVETGKGWTKSCLSGTPKPGLKAMSKEQAASDTKQARRHWI